MADGKIDLDGLPVAVPGTYDYLVGTQLGNARKWPLPEINNAAALIADGINQVISEAQAEAAPLIAGLGYLPPVAFAAGLVVNTSRFTVSRNGEVYAPVSWPFTTTATFNPAQWRVIQGVTGPDLLADDGAAMVGFIQRGTSAVLRNMLEKARESVSVLDFGADPTGGADCAPAFQRAHDYVASVASAAGRRPKIRAPGGRYRMASSFVVTAPHFSLEGDGNNTVLIADRADGGAVIDVNNADFFRGDSFRVLADGIDFTDWIAGTVNARNCIGVRLRDTSNRWRLNDVLVSGCKTGYDIEGFIGQGSNVWATNCELGFKGHIINSTSICLRIENCRKSYAITASNAVHLDQIIDEGGCVGAVASTIDGCSGVKFTAPYMEVVSTTGRTTPYLVVGGASLVRDFRMESGSCGFSGSSVNGIHPLKLDNVDGASVDLFIGAGLTVSSIETTANTKNYRLNAKQQDTTAWLHDNSRQLGAAYNYFPNRGFDLWLRGWESVSATRAAISIETTLVRKGRNAARITCAAGAGFNSASFRIPVAAREALRGRRIRAAAWVWVPDIPAFQLPAATQPARPGVVIESFNGTATTLSTTVNNGGKPGQWNLMVTPAFEVQADCTRLTVQVYPNQSNSAVTGSEFVVVDSIVVFEDATPLRRVINDDLIDSPMIGSVGISGKLVSFGTAAPGGALQVYEVGDRVLNSAPAQGQPDGWVCTAAGTPGTWRALGTVA